MQRKRIGSAEEAYWVVVRDDVGPCGGRCVASVYVWRTLFGRALVFLGASMICPFMQLLVVCSIVAVVATTSLLLVHAGSLIAL